MSTGFKRLTDFLVELGVEKVAHSGKSFLAHLIGEPFHHREAEL